MRSLKFDQIKMTSGLGPTVRPAAPPQELASGSGSWKAPGANDAGDVLAEQIQDARAAQANAVPSGKPKGR